jgi:GNAT superfamily N-acetyltransferase
VSGGRVPGPAAAAPGRVREAAPRDLDRLATLFGRLVAHHAALGPAFAARSEAAVEDEARAWLAREGEQPHVRVLCWDADGDLQGLCVVRVARRPPLFVETVRGGLDHLVVRPDARRRGVGRALVQAAMEWLRTEGATRLEITVVRGNPEGAAFWRALGFRPAMDVLDRPL